MADDTTKPVVTTPAPTSADGKPASTAAAAADGDKTLLESAGDTGKAVGDQAAIEAENKRIMDADEATLSAEDKAKKAELVKAKAAEDAKKVPEKYEFKVPDGMTVDEKAVEVFSPVFKEIGLTQEQAQKLINVYAPFLQQQAETARISAQNSFKEMVGEWEKDSIKEFSQGGADHLKEMAYAAKAKDKFATPELVKLLSKEETGLGNHKEVIRFFIKVGKAISTDSFPDGKPAGRDDSDEAKANRLFPTMKK